MRIRVYPSNAKHREMEDCQKTMEGRGRMFYFFQAFDIIRFQVSTPFQFCPCFVRLF
uniref:Uncharacterized protein n=1 Tax=Anguilla anguilla TaxID=7936 RepID=A0A0E9SR70_ANGAN